MSRQTWREALIIGQGDGPTLTAAAAASCIPTHAKITLPQGYFERIGQGFKVSIAGRISCVVTTPGTARFDVRLGGTVIYDSGALNLNVVAKTTVPFWFEAWLTARTIGTAGNFMGVGRFMSEAVVGAPVNTAGGNGVLMCPVGAPAVGSNVDMTTALSVDMFFTQTVATGSLTVHQYLVESLN